MAAFYREVAKYFRMVRFDPRGAGISGEPPDEGVSFDGLARDVQAVAEALEVDDLVSLGVTSLGPTAVRLAVDRPDLVTHLVLCDTGPRLADLPLDAYVRATDAVVGLGVIPSLAGLFPTTLTDDLPALERLMRGSLYNRAPTKPRYLRHFDVTSVLDQVRAPTLVIKTQDCLYTDTAQTRLLLSGTPNSELRIVPGTMAPWLADLDSMVEALVSFLTSGHHRPQSTDEMLTVVFTDLVSSSELLDREGDVSGRRAFRKVEDLIAGLSSSHSGQVVKHLGDGSLITFNSTRRAIAFALDLQDQMMAHPVQMRIGMAAGEPIQDRGDVHGAVVVQASRIADLGAAGEVIVSDSVRQLALGKEFEFELRGEVHLKGFEETQRVWVATRSAERARPAII